MQPTNKNKVRGSLCDEMLIYLLSCVHGLCNFISYESMKTENIAIYSISETAEISPVSGVGRQEMTRES